MCIAIEHALNMCMRVCVRAIGVAHKVLERALSFRGSVRRRNIRSELNTLYPTQPVPNFVRGQ